MRSDYYTRLSSATAPITANEPVYSTTDYSYTGTAYIGNKEYQIIKYASSGTYAEMRPINRIHNSEGYVESSIVFPKYYYFRRDHLGNNREVWLANTDSTVQRTQYYPSGLPWKTNTDDNPGVQPYKYNGKEFIEMHGLDETDLGARGLHHAKMRFNTMDRFAEKYPWQSPYCFARNNPVNNIDINGDSTIISGQEHNAALQQLQAATSNELIITQNASGTLNVSYIGEGTPSAEAQQILAASNSSTITVNIVAENTMFTSSDNLYIGGAFMGNIVTKTANGNTVVANQEVNPQVLENISKANGKPVGTDMLHEFTEAYQGALISQKKGISSPMASQAGSIYQQAHDAATPQSGIVTETVFTTFGTTQPPLPSGNYQYPVGRVEWSVVNTSGNKIIIQSLRQ